jgi:WD40 repeat protein
VQEAALSADGRFLVTRSADRTLRVWDAAAGKELRQLPVPVKQWRQQQPVELALSADGRTLAWVGGGRERLVHVCDTDDGRERCRLGGHEGFDRQVVLASDGRSLLASSDSGIDGPGLLQLWDLTTGKLRHEWKGAVKGPWLLTAAFAPDGRTLVVTMPGAALCRLEAATGRELWRVPQRTASTIQDAFAFSPDGTTLMVAPFGGPVLERRELATGRRLPAQGELEGFVPDVAFAADGHTLYSFDADGVLRAWATATGKFVRQRSLGCTGGATFSPDGGLVAVGDDRAVRVCENAGGRELWRTTRGWVVFSPDGRLVAAVGKDGITVHEAATGKERTRLPGPGGAGPAFTPGGEELVLLADGGQPPGAHFWDVASGRERRRVSLPPYKPGVLLLSPDGKTAVLGAEDTRGGGSLLLVEAATGGKRAEVLLREIMPVWTWPPVAAFSPDGRSLLVADGTGAVAVLDPCTGRLLQRLEGHHAVVTSLRFSPGGRLLATGSADATALVWKTADALRSARLSLAALPVAERAALWDDLAGGDAARAARAVRRLSLAPDALPWLGTQLRPVPALGEEDRQRLDRSLKDLDSDEFTVRKRAEAEIERLGEAALPAVEKVLAGSPSPEVRRAADRLVERITPDRSPEALRALRAVEALEQMDTAEARALLQGLARGAEGARLTRDARAALQRLNRRAAVP